MRFSLLILSIMVALTAPSTADTNFASAKNTAPQTTLRPIVVSAAHADFVANNIPDTAEYTVGNDDILTITVLQPEQILNDVTVSPDGTIAFPYIGNFIVKGMTINKVQEEVQGRLANGYLKYPSVVVSLKESRSRKFFVYGEVNKPGPYYIEDKATVLRAISMAGGFTRFGSASRVKILRPKEPGGYTTLQVNIKSVMDGDDTADMKLKSGDIVVVSEGIM